VIPAARINARSVPFAISPRSLADATGQRRDARREDAVLVALDQDSELHARQRGSPGLSFRIPVGTEFQIALEGSSSSAEFREDAPI
jgi:hypothetical protein